MKTKPGSIAVDAEPGPAVVEPAQEDVGVSDANSKVGEKPASIVAGFVREDVGDAWCVDKAAPPASEVIKSPHVLEGNASHYPLVGTVVCESGRHSWRLLVEINANNPIGLMRAEGDFSASMNNGPDSWAFWPSGRIIDREGLRSTREVGPDRFTVPLQVEMHFDCSTGVLRAIANDVDLGIIAELPLGERVRLAVGMNCGSVTLLQYEQHADLVLTCIPTPAAEDGSQTVSCLNMSGEELAAVACASGSDVLQLRKAITDELDKDVKLVSIAGKILADGDPISSLSLR